MKKAIRIFDMFFSAICAFLFALIGIGQVFMPNSVVLDDNDSAVFSKIYSCSEKSTSKLLVDYQSAVPKQRTLKLFGIIPVKNIIVKNQNDKVLFVSGDTFGIKLYTDGVIVVGTQNVETSNGKINPAKNAGVEVGDVVVSINNKKVYNSLDVENALNDNNGKDYEIIIKRNETFKNVVLTPAYSDKEGCFKAGMWVRDSTAGIGTITYYDEDNGTFAALGHPINDVDTNKKMPLLDGQAVEAKVSNVYKATNGETGSLSCIFKNNVIGKLTDNTDCGIFGKYNAISSNTVPYPVATKQEIEKGPAQIISSVTKDGKQYYDIEIERISYAEDNDNKNMIIKVVDDDLISKTGGIVQGMSGSPIIQNGKIIGAVTHVFVNDATKGYAIFIENMLEQKQ